jgi:hypothetical protein
MSAYKKYESTIDCNSELIEVAARGNEEVVLKFLEALHNLKYEERYFMTFTYHKDIHYGYYTSGSGVKYYHPIQASEVPVYKESIKRFKLFLLDKAHISKLEISVRTADQGPPEGSPATATDVQFLKNITQVSRSGFAKDDSYDTQDDSRLERREFLASETSVMALLPFQISLDRANRLKYLYLRFELEAGRLQADGKTKWYITARHDVDDLQKIFKYCCS